MGTVNLDDNSHALLNTGKVTGRIVGGFKYVLTGINLATRYPEAIPLKDIWAETVAEGMVEVFSRSGIRRQLLTDQGSQFVGQLTTQLCIKLNIEEL